jgi:3-oxoadipate enol-lactonase
VPYADVGDVELYYEQGGDPSGPPVLVISGTGSDLRQEPNPLASPLVERFNVLVYDQRGLGRSAKPDRPYTMADYGRDAIGLLDAVGWARSAVFGISFGGMVAQEMALHGPDRVERLVLCCTSAGGAGSASYPLHELQGLGDEERMRTMLPLVDTRWDDAWQAAHPAVVDLYRSRRPFDPDDPAAADGARRQLEARAQHDTFDRLPGLTMPALVCAGRYDGIAPLANSEALVDQLPEGSLEVFEGGHAFLLQDPRAWTVIGSFLEAGRPDAG